MKQNFEGREAQRSEKLWNSLAKRLVNALHGQRGIARASWANISNNQKNWWLVIFDFALCSILSGAALYAIINGSSDASAYTILSVHLPIAVGLALIAWDIEPEFGVPLCGIVSSVAFCSACVLAAETATAFGILIKFMCMTQLFALNGIIFSRRFSFALDFFILASVIGSSLFPDGGLGNNWSALPPLGILMVGLVATVAFWTQFLANRARDAQFSLLVNTQTAMVKLEGTHRRAEEIHRMQEELARFKRIASIEAVATSIAHEINQPVGSAQTFAEAAARWLALDPPNLAEVRNAIGQIVCQTTRAGEIITTIRRMSSRGSIQYQVVNLASVIDDAANVLSAEIDDARVEFNIMRQTDNVIVMGSVDELMNVFVNIIRNAIESFRALDGRRVITVGISSADKGWVDCEIKDNGAGIAAKDLDHIFETYFTTKERGMGIGLAVCRYLVERHGGSLIMRSSPGQGTVAIVRFPQQVEAG